RGEWDGLISIDTAKAAVAEAALSGGADLVNDVTGLRGDHRMIEVCRESGAGVIVMHMQGEPRTMQAAPHYEDVVTEVRAFFENRWKVLTGAGIEAECLSFDPGIGFGKTLEHNLALLAHLDRLVVHERPLVVGLSRKSFIGKVLGDNAPELREWPTIALTAAMRGKGAMIHRVHAVRENREALRMMEAVLKGDG
ncbi:MAG: dihydropteroate synthase, partial [Akkermansiaceae bacterium]|nr:dihydropteroate synthase [Akkermansiaceae bacterium]